MDEQIKLEDLCNQVATKMQEMGYKDDAIGRYRRAWWDMEWLTALGK